MSDFSGSISIGNNTFCYRNNDYDWRSRNNNEDYYPIEDESYYGNSNVPSQIRDNETGAIYVLQDLAQRALDQCRNSINQGYNGNGWSMPYQGNPMNVFNNNNYYNNGQGSNAYDRSSWPENWASDPNWTFRMGQQMLQQSAQNYTGIV
jgi:hypothetical protein